MDLLSYFIPFWSKNKTKVFCRTLQNWWELGLLSLWKNTLKWHKKVHIRIMTRATISMLFLIWLIQKSGSNCLQTNKTHLDFSHGPIHIVQIMITQSDLINIKNASTFSLTKWDVKNQETIRSKILLFRISLTFGLTPFKMFL